MPPKAEYRLPAEQPLDEENERRDHRDEHGNECHESRQDVREQHDYQAKENETDQDFHPKNLQSFSAKNRVQEAMALTSTAASKMFVQKDIAISREMKKAPCRTAGAGGSP